ncbi:MAG: hypothetical protein OEW95_04480 [Candidatus Bathyarchaeota archaeon]|nr:hypothetical protein [Candidatus Bathyarchaeota archaeon]
MNPRASIIKHEHDLMRGSDMAIKSLVEIVDVTKDPEKYARL